jgi:hypothetical protein
MARSESPLGVENSLVEPSPEAHAAEGNYITSTLALDSREVPVSVLNATPHDQQLMKGSPWHTVIQSR